MPVDEPNPLEGLSDLFSHLEAARAELEAQESAIHDAVVEGSAAGGAVVISLTGDYGAVAVRIDPALIDPADPAMLEDGVLAALRDALERVDELRASVEGQSEARFAEGIDLGELAANLDVESLLGGIDIAGLMGSLGVPQMPGAIEAPVTEDSEDSDPPEEPS